MKAFNVRKKNRRDPLQSFSGKVVVITGASSGIGKELALMLAPASARLILIGRDPKRLEDTRKEVAALDAEVHVVRADVADSPNCRTAIREAAGRFGTLDYLFCNAGQAMKGPFQEAAGTEATLALMHNNFGGVVNSIYHSLPYLVDSRGHITVTGGLVGLLGVPHYTGYSASKHAVRGFVNALRHELAASGVTITLVHPDIVQTSIRQNMLDASGNPSPADYVEPNVMPATECARLIVAAAAEREPEAFLTRRSRLLPLLQLILPSLLDRLLAPKVTAQDSTDRSNAA